MTKFAPRRAARCTGVAADAGGSPFSVLGSGFAFKFVFKFVFGFRFGAARVRFGGPADDPRA
jgi:hypothetical protein